MVTKPSSGLPTYLPQPSKVQQPADDVQRVQDFQQSSVSGWMHSNWVATCSLASLSYLLFIFGVSHLMKDR